MAQKTRQGWLASRLESELEIVSLFKKNLSASEWTYNVLPLVTPFLQLLSTHSIEVSWILSYERFLGHLFLCNKNH